MSEINRILQRKTWSHLIPALRTENLFLALRKVYKELLAVRKALSPKHELFRTGNLEGLKKGVKEVERLLLECKNFVKPDEVCGLEPHMRLGVKGIVTENTVKPTEKKEGRPALNTEDLDY